jgi:serine beta-lactamase-like protein LACTB
MRSGYTTNKIQDRKYFQALTALGAAILYEQKRLNLDVPIQRYVPDFPDKGYVITVRQLLGHLGGIRHYNQDESIENQRHYSSVTEALTRFQNDPLVAVPGTEYHYSTYGYTLVSSAIERASGQDFLSFMHDSVFLPLGMENTVADENEMLIKNRAHWYQIEQDGSFRNSPYADLSYKWAGGGFLSTAEDLVRFGSALLHSGILHRETLNEMFTPQRTQAGTETHYGLGWFVYAANEHGPEPMYEHDGGSVGSSSWLVIYPDHDLVIAWLMNNDDLQSTDNNLYHIASSFFAEPARVPPIPDASKR